MSRNSPWTHKIFAFILIAFFSLSVVHTSFAQEFTAHFLGDYGNVTVVEVAGSYGANNPDGSVNDAPRQAIAKEFFQTHKDEYDFLVIFSNFDFPMPDDGHAKAFYMGVKNDIQGIGIDQFNNTEIFGSTSSRLQGLVDMGNLSGLATDPLDAKFNDTLYILSHELVHRWGAHVKFKQADGNLSTALLGKDGSHWSFLFDSRGSVMYGNRWQDNGNGTFTSLSPQSEAKFYSPLDLYLMGIIDKSRVPPMLLIENPSIDPARLPEAGVTISGTARSITIDDIIAAEGERIPNVSSSQTSFKTAFIYITAPGTFNADAIYQIENVRNGFVTRHSILTDGQSIVEVASTPKEDVPVNPGILPPSTSPRTLPPDINQGVQWLMSSQKTDGSWSDVPETIERDTAEAVLVLKTFSEAQASYSSGLQWLAASSSGNMDYLSRKIEAFQASNQDVSGLVAELLSRKNSDGGWGSDRWYKSNSMDTAIALKAMAVSGYGVTSSEGQSVVAAAIQYLKGAQKTDGGWTGNGESTIQATAAVLTAFNTYNTAYSLNDSITKGTAWLLSKQNSDGGFGNSPSTVYDTALTVLALRELNASTEITNKGLEYLLAQQSENGSWQNSAYQTALAVGAVYKATVDPDLAIKAAGITFFPASVTSLPANIVINANISNTGMTGVSQAKAVLYKDSVSEANKIGEQIIAFPGQSVTAVTFQTVISDGNEHLYYIVVDPDNVVKESSEANNAAVGIIRPETTYDFEILSSDLAVSPNPVDQLQDVKITAKITNKGTMNAYNVQVRYFIDEPGAPYEMATLTVDIPAGATIAKDVTWLANKAGANLQIVIQVDPFDNFSELLEMNNKATVPLMVNAVNLTDPNLTVSYKDIVITPSPANQGGNATISAIVKNDGYSAANNITVNFYHGVLGPDGTLLGTQTIPALAPGESVRVAVDWTNIQKTGEEILYVQADPNNLIKELIKDDNEAFTTLNILSLPDLTVSGNAIAMMPAFPKEGDSVTITATIKNQGVQGVQNVVVNAHEGNVLIGSQVFSSIPGTGFADVSFIYDATGKEGTHTIMVTVDPADAIIEQNNANNSATKTFIVLNSNMWVTERYISPNGDGVQDETKFFFRLAAAQTVVVTATNERGETVRTFTGPDLTNITDGWVLWDGLDDSGRVVDDGEYQFRVMDATMQSLGLQVVVVDNNRSPLTKAIGTDYLHKQDIGCNAPFRGKDWLWANDESGFYVNATIYYENSNNWSNCLLYSPLDAQDKRILSSPSWYSQYSTSQSPDKLNISFYQDANRVYKIGIWNLEDGLRFHDLGFSAYTPVLGHVWSPDSASIAVNSILQPQKNYYTSSLKIFNLKNTQCPSVTLLDYAPSFAWSLDSSKLAYFDSNTSQVVVSDVCGTNRQTIYSSVSGISLIAWLDNERILFTKAGYGTGVINLADGTTTKISEFFWPELSPDRKKFIAKEGGTNFVHIVSIDGKTAQSYHLPTNYGISYGKWSPDSRYVAFTQAGSAIVVDSEANRMEILPSAYYVIGWYDQKTLIYGGIKLFNVETNETHVLSSVNGWNWPSMYGSSFAISPSGNFLSWQDTWLDSCQQPSYFLTTSLLNLTAKLSATKRDDGVTFKGIAADRNFGSYRLEYADTKTPELWTLIAPTSDVPVINDVFTTWAPPYEGTFQVRLTVQDKAGNVAMDKQRVSWGKSLSVTNFQKDRDIFSPNGDGSKDTMELRYRVLDPVHLEFAIYDPDSSLVRTVTKDHDVPGDEYMIWDGTDDSGRMVPDGKYKIKVFDYEFFVDVDTTPPDVNITLGKIEQSSLNPLPSLDLVGHATDPNLATWVIESGEGDNPQTWDQFMNGDEQVTKKDQNGNLLLNPVQDAVLYSFKRQAIGWLKAKKMRISAEDAAGNRTTKITGFVEETMRLYQWNDNYMYGIVPADLIRPGVPLLGGFETIRLPLASMNVQYRTADRIWRDVQPPVTNNTAGIISIPWDISELHQDIVAVRIRAIDSLGIEHFSNTLTTTSIFSIHHPKCSASLEAKNHLFEKLISLRLQVRSSQDSRYTSWTDFMVYDASHDLPEGKFFPLPPSYYPGMIYEIRMIGVDDTGKVHESDASLFPSSCPVGISLDVSFREADCGAQSNAAALKTQLNYTGDTAGLSLKSLRYYIERPEGRQLLSTFGNVLEGLSTTIDTSNLSEGRYTVKAVLTYMDASSSVPVEVTAENTLIVDRVLPVAQMTYPSKSTALCPTKMADTNGDWYGIHVEGQATDNNQVKRYELHYGVGENMSLWTPAMTHTGGQLKAITGEGSKQGALGAWDVTSLKHTSLSLKLKVIDASGNASCTTTSFSIDTLTEITNVTADKALFSPNGDGTLDDVTVSYKIDEYATTGVKVNKLTTINGSEIFDSVPVSTIASGVQHLGGTGSATWNGNGDLGISVVDGRYGIVVSAADSCGNTTQKWKAIEIDSTRPVTAIFHPRPGDPLGNMVEVRGTAEDLHFQSFTLEAGQGDAPATWSLISSNTAPVVDGILGKWNTFDLNGRWTLRLTATDAVGNKNETIASIDLGTRQSIIKMIDIAPKLFSPNNDAKLDSAVINFEITDSCDVKIDILDAAGTVRKTYTATAVFAGSQSYTWDGVDNANSRVADGSYTARLTATLTSNPAMSQTEAVTVIVDTTPPSIVIAQPVNNSFLSGQNPAVTGSISDRNISEYALHYTGVVGTTLLDQANQSRDNFTFGSLDALPDGDYSLAARSSDVGLNETVKTVSFTVDRTPPVVKLDAPKEGEYYGTVSPGVDGKQSGVMSITSSIVEKNMDVFSLRYGAGGNPTQWTDLVTGTTATAYPSPFTWKVGKNDSIPDGLYTLSLMAKDKAGSTGETRVKVTVDNTSPAVSITIPLEGGYVKSAGEVNGTAFDENIDKYFVEISEGQCASAFKWVALKTSPVPVQGGVLADWQAIPPDGDYCVRLSAVDKVGSRAEAHVNVKVDTHPPVAPALSGVIENRSDSRLNWVRNTETDIAGYNLYRNGQKVNVAPIVDPGYLDQNLSQGVFAYTLKAVDSAGWESAASNEVKLTIDITGPDARIRAPLDSSKASGLIDIKGTAYSSDDFKQYRVYVGQGPSPSAWNIIRTSPVSISYGTLAQWDTLGLTDGAYSVKLEAEDLTGNITTHQIQVTIDNIPPAAPVLVSAVPNGADVALTWSVNTDVDLAGYLLYRNDQLANASGIVIGELKPYLLTGTSYLNKTLPDGTFRYHLVAMDQAGNTGDQSNTLTVSIDTHAPKAAIAEPANAAKFENKIFLRAESPDLDIASVQFQYKRTQDAAWLNLGAAVIGELIAAYLDPAALGLSYGDYQLRAIAKDSGGKTDSSPSAISVTYTDLTAPNVPQNFNVLTNGKTVTLTWTANAESDLNGYNIYRTTGSTRTKINTTLIKQATYQDENLVDGSYSYDLTAIDTFNNESKPSTTASAKVYAPTVTQPRTAVTQNSVQIQGNYAEANGTVEVYVETREGNGLQGTVIADAAGKFSFDAVLAMRENSITARVVDSVGNISRTSNTVVVVYNEAPAVPTGLTAIVNSYDVNLTWNPNTETDLVGYNLYRDGQKVNSPVTVPSGTATASSYSSSSYAPSKAFDGNQGTSWVSSDSYGTFKPEWWQIEFSAPELVSRIEIHWLNTNNIGKDFEIQGWTGNFWLSLANVAGNTLQDNTFDLNPSYNTNKIRVYITEVNSSYSYKRVEISEVKIFKEQPISDTFFDDLNLSNGQHNYSVTAVDYYGLESLPSGTITAEVGDITPPASPQNLTASVSGSDVALDWSVNSEADFAGYYIYRNAGQDWIKINSQLVSINNYSDLKLRNGIYSYRITAVDRIGNESSPAETQAVINVTPPEAPVDLSISSLPDGTLALSWGSGTGSTKAFNLYRAVTVGGPYSKINKSVITKNSFLDSGLISGTRYYYIATAVDLSGNESAYSNEASGTPLDSVAPSKPTIQTPTTSGNSITTYDGQTDISGFGETDSVIELFNNGVPTGSVAAGKKDVYQTVAIGSVSSPAVSPNGKTLAYYTYAVDRYYIWLMNLATQQTTQITSGYNPLWSPDSGKIIYGFSNSNGYSKIGIYDIVSGETYFLNNDISDAYVYELNPSVSSDASRIAYISNKGGSRNLWLKDIASNYAVQVSQGLSVYTPTLSPDGLKLAYFGCSAKCNLYVYDTSSGAITIVDDAPNIYYLDWSTQGILSFGSSRTGYGEIFAFDPAEGTLNQITNSRDYKANPHWSPDGNNITFVNNWNSLWIASCSSGQSRQLQTGTFNSINWLKSGQISYRDGSNLYFLTPDAGYFEFKDVHLNPGENVFSAVAIDVAGNSSDQSGTISVIYDTSRNPDLAVTADDVYLYPPYPVAGDQMAVNVAVWNKGQTAANNVGVDIYMWNANGQLELLKSEHIASIEGESAELVSAIWDSSGKVGENRLVVVIDPSDTIAEIDESNNMAINDFIVTADEGVAVTTALDSTQIAANVNAGITITAWNNGIKKDVIVEAQVEDENGNPVVAFDAKTMTLAYGTNQAYAIAWNTGNTYAGDYKVHSVLKDDTGILAENIVPFTILPDLTIGATLITNKAGYGTSETVSLSSTVVNKGQNYMIPALVAKLRINDPAGSTLFIAEKSMVNLLPGSTSSLTSTWNTGTNPAGIYTAVLEVYVDSRLITTESASFTIGSVVVISGNLAVSPSIAPVDSMVLADYTISNSGNSDAAGLLVQVQVIDPETQILMYSHDDMMDLPKNSNRAGQVDFATEGYGLKTYSVLVRYTLDGVTRNIGSGSFTLRDYTPPAIDVVSPTEGTTYNATIPITAIATDNASGIEKVEYRIDGGQWKLLPIADLSQGRYATHWEPALSDNGPHSVDVRATDKAGNVSESVSVSFIIQMDSIPPVTTITVGEPTYESSGNRYVATGSAFTLSATDNFSGVAKTEYQLDGGSWTAYAGAFALTSYGNGTHTIRYRSTDKAGNEESAKELTVIRDTISPMTAISASDPLINGVINTVSHTTTFTLSAEDALSGVRTIAYRIDEGQWQAYAGSFSLAGLGAGQHVIAFKATDNVLNEESEQTITVQLVVIEVEKKVAVDPIVLVGLWSDNSDLEQKQADINNLNALLSSAGMTYTIALNTDEFTVALRSGRYNTYILIDVKEPLIGEEVREAVHFGNGLVFIKTRQDADPFIDDVFGVKLTGKTTSPDLVVSLVSSPISNEGALQMAGKAIVASYTTTDTAQSYGIVTDRQETIPVVIANQYGRGRAILYTFDLLRAPDQAQASALLVGSLNQVRPTEHYIRALDSVPVRTELTSSTTPVDVKVVETIPDTTTADTIMPQAALQNNTITWSSILSPDRKTMFAYYLNLPDRAGSYSIDTELKFKNGSDYVPYGDYSLTLMVPYDSSGLLQDMLTELNSRNTLDANGIKKALGDLSTIDINAVTLKGAEQNILAILNAVDDVRELSVDAAVLRLKLDELLRIQEKKWYLLKLQE